MKTKQIKTLIIGTWFFSLYLVTPCSVSKGQIAQPESVLQKTVSVNLKEVFAGQVLEFLAKEYGIPCGIEIVSSGKTKTTEGRISISLSEVTVQQVLDSIVQADTGYRWQVIDGVINFIPKEDAHGLLNVKVKSFQIRNADRMEAKRAIVSLREVKAKLKSLGLEPAILSFYSVHSKRDSLKLSISLHNVTLRQVLNEIAKKTNFWAVSIFGEFFLIQI